MSPGLVSQDGADVLIRIKAVPGASRDEVAGTVGGRLKVRVSAPPEGGRANKAIIALLARALGVKPRQVSIERGATQAAKVVRVAGVTTADVEGTMRPTGGKPNKSRKMA